MSEPVKLLAFAGSARTGSLNQHLIEVMAGLAREEGAEVTVVKVGDIPLPLYNGDMEASDGLPENAVKWKQLFKDHDGFLIACPEYNGSITALLKNIIDWVSRPEPDGPGMRNFEGKAVALCAASGGSMGGLRGLTHVRQIFSNLGANVAGRQVALGNAGSAYNEDGSIEKEALATMARNSMKDVIAMARGLSGKY